MRYALPVASLLLLFGLFPTSAKTHELETADEYFDILQQKLTKLHVAVEIDDHAVCNSAGKLAAYRFRSKTLVLCKSAFAGGDSDDRILKLETITHELVHIVQDCSDGLSTVSVSALFDQNSHSMMVDRLSQSKLSVIEDFYRSSDWALEVEAFYLEDRPIRVLKLMDEVCL